MYYILKQLDCNNKLKYRCQVFVIVFLVSRIHEEEIQPTWEFNCPKWDQEYKENGILHTFLNYLTRLYSNENFANFYLNSHSMLRNKHKSSKLINVRLCNGSGLSKTNLSFYYQSVIHVYILFTCCWFVEEFQEWHLAVSGIKRKKAEWNT